MFNDKVSSLKPLIVSKLESRLASAKERLDAVRRLKPEDKSAIWISARKVHDIEEELRSWAKLK